LATGARRLAERPADGHALAQRPQRDQPPGPGLIEALRRTSRLGERAAALAADCRSAIATAAAYARAHFEDPPDIRDWVWEA